MKLPGRIFLKQVKPSKLPSRKILPSTFVGLCRKDAFKEKKRQNRSVFSRIQKQTPSKAEEKNLYKVVVKNKSSRQLYLTRSFCLPQRLSVNTSDRANAIVIRLCAVQRSDCCNDRFVIAKVVLN